MKKVIVLTVLAIILILTLGSIGKAEAGHLKLLAVSQEENKLTGSIADLYLDIKPGEGRVFIDTQPASKLDTQMSTRLAKNMACKYVDADCSKYDFFYTIKAESVIIGGPSASAAITLLTISLLEDIELDSSVAITGTINSGNLIGSVGGLKEKIQAGADNGVKKVLIPAGTRLVTEEENKTIDLIEYGKNLSIEVYEVGTVDEALFHYTGKNFEKDTGKLLMSKTYKETMKYLAEKLCKRTSLLKEELNDLMLKKINIDEEDFIEREKQSINMTQKAERAFEENDYYSAASFCFGANVNYKQLFYENFDWTDDNIFVTYNNTKNKIDELNIAVSSKKRETITDLQTYMIVKERLIEANDLINKIEPEIMHINDKNRDKILNNMAYATERWNSAVAWSKFFGKTGKKFIIEEDNLRQSCIQKLSETQEVYQYIELMIPGLLVEAKNQLEKANGFKEKGNYELCLSKASIAKAQINLISSSMGVKEEEVDLLLERKLEAARKVIIEQQEKGIFPILGYSYYEYALSLKNDESNKYSALLYAEYALELSNLDIYFEESSKFKLGYVKTEVIIVFLIGIVIGFLINELGHVLKKIKQEKKKPKKKKKRKSR